MSDRIKSQLDYSLEITTTIKEFNFDRVIYADSDISGQQWPNVLISGQPGSGKTSVVKEWADERGVLLVSYDLRRDVERVHEEDQFAILRLKKAENPLKVAQQLIFDTLSRYKDGEDFILLLDDYHLATKENLEAVNYTIDTHKIINPATNEVIELKNLLFTIAITTE